MLVIIQDRADATVLGEQRIAAVAEQVQEERLNGLLLAVALDFVHDCLRRFARDEGQCAGPGDEVAVAGRGGAVHGAVRHRHGLIVGGRDRDREDEKCRLALLALGLRHVADAGGEKEAHLASVQKPSFDQTEECKLLSQLNHQ